MSDKLLYAIGASESKSIKNFDDVFTELCLKTSSEELGEDYRNIRRKVIRLLDALGYCEFDFRKSRVFPCPPAIVFLPSGGLQRAVLTGVRSPEIMEKIKDIIRKNQKDISLLIKHQNIKAYSYNEKKSVALEFPSTVLFEYFDKQVIQKLAEKTGIYINVNIPASWAFLKYSIGLEEYREKVVWDRAKEDEVNWPRRYFNPDNFLFSRSIPQDSSNYFLVEYINPITNQREHWLWEGDKAAKVDRDWGRFEILSRKYYNVILYDIRHHILAAPAFIPLPRFLARAATMCSGLVPFTTRIGEMTKGNIQAHSQISVYVGVPPEYASLISSKICQDLIKCSIQVEESGVIIS